jgi:hypothetical protein
MTEPRGRTARWTAAALAAPVAASVFAGTTAWAAHSDPLHPKGQATSAPAPTPSATTDAAMLALNQALAAQTLKMNLLAKQVAAVKAQAASLSAGGSGASARGGTTSKRYSSGTTSRSGGTKSTGSRSTGSGSSGGGTTAAKPPPAPPPQTTTGASGVKP